MDISEIVTIVCSLIALTVIMGLLVISVFMNAKEEKDNFFLDGPVPFPSYMDCPTCPNTTFILADDDNACIVECSRCNVSYIVDIDNKKLVKR